MDLAIQSQIAARAELRCSMVDTGYEPVAFDPKAFAKEKCAQSAAFKDAYDALEDEFAELDAFLNARNDSLSS